MHLHKARNSWLKTTWISGDYLTRLGTCKCMALATCCLVCLAGRWLSLLMNIQLVMWSLLVPLLTIHCCMYISVWTQLRHVLCQSNIPQWNSKYELRIKSLECLSYSLFLFLLCPWEDACTTSRWVREFQRRCRRHWLCLPPWRWSPLSYRLHR